MVPIFVFRPSINTSAVVLFLFSFVLNSLSFISMPKDKKWIYLPWQVALFTGAKISPTTNTQIVLISFTVDTLAIPENQIIFRSYFAFVTYTAFPCVVTQRSFQRTAAENWTTFLSVHSVNPTSASMMRAKFRVHLLLQSQSCFCGCPTWDWQEENQETTLALEDTLDLASSLQSSKFL